MKKSYLTVVIGLLVVIAIGWVGLTVYDSIGSVEINPNAQQYTTPIKPNFDTAIVDDVGKKVAELPVSPDVFHKLEQKNADKNAAN